jgi:hypothetical protein
MRNIIVAGAVALALGAVSPAFAESKTAKAAKPAAAPAPSQAEVDALRAELARLAARLNELEAKQADATAKADTATRQTASVDTRLNEIEASNDNQTDQIAKAKAKVDAADWATKFKWKGDFRYRNETFNVQNTQDRWRDRLRLRTGFDAKVSDTVNFGLQIATGDDADPRSTNATLTDASQRKSIRLDQAYVDWKAFDGAVVTLGKQKQPWFRPGNSLFFDGDVNPEGGSLKYANPSGAFANAWAFWLREAGGAADANMYGGQLGWKFPVGLTIAASYTDYGAIQGKPIFSTAAWVDSPANNSTYLGSTTAGAVCNAVATGGQNCYRYDYKLLQIGAQYDVKLGALPLMLFADYIKNSDPNDLNTAFTGGFLLGKASNPGTWEFGALYEKLEKDAQFGAFVDSDFAGGLTQGKGWQVRGAYAPAKNVTLNLQYFVNKRNFDTAAEADYKRLQLDANFKF